MITQLHVDIFFYFIKTSDFCGLFPVSGKNDMEHVISKKLQLKRKAEVTISVIRVKKTYTLKLFEHSSKGNFVKIERSC